METSSQYDDQATAEAYALEDLDEYQKMAAREIAAIRREEYKHAEMLKNDYEMERSSGEYGN